MIPFDPFITLEIPIYPRKIKVADKRRPKYYKFEADGGIRSGKKELPDSFYIPNTEVRFTGEFNTKVTRLKPEYTLGIYLGNKIWGHWIRNDIGTIKEFILTGKSTKEDQLKSTYLIHVDSKERVLANPKVAGTPHYKRVNFQDLYSGNMHEHTRAKMVELLHEYFDPYIEKLPVIDNYPVTILLEIVDTVKNHYDNSKDAYGRAWDVDNRGIIYGKVLMDALVKNKKLYSDDRLYVTGPPAFIFTPLPDNDHVNRVLRMYISKDTRSIITNNKYYQEYGHKQNNTGGDNNPW